MAVEGPSVNVNSKLERLWPSPIVTVAFILMASLGGMFAAQSWTQRAVHPVNAFFLGLDFRDYFFAGRAMVLHQSPYILDRYVTPPLPAYLASTFCRNSFYSVVPYVFFASIASILGGIGCFVAALKNKHRWRIFAATSVIASIGFPFLFLIDRGNIDGFVFLFVGLFVFLLSRKQHWLAGISLGLAVCLKVYPILLIAPLILRRKYAAAAGAALTVLVSVIAQPGLWATYVDSRLFTRTAQFRISENGSLAVVLKGIFYPLIHNNADLGIPLLGIVGIILVANLVLDRKRNEGDAAIIATYLPLMVAMPALSYLYSFVNIIPVMLILSRRAKVATVGFALTQINAVSWEQATGFQLQNFLPSLGLALIIGCLLIEKTRDYRTATPHEPKVHLDPAQTLSA